MSETDGSASMTQIALSKHYQIIINHNKKITYSEFQSKLTGYKPLTIILFAN